MSSTKPNDSQPRVAYYCMEYGLDPSFRIYSGGLGILAGDFLKAARDGGYPLVGVGVLWQQGYGEQRVSPDGNVSPLFKTYKHPAVKDTGVRVKVRVRQRPVTCRVWSCTAFGNVPLYLLDTNLPENGPNAAITDRLYSGDAAHRIEQEIVLGCGGYLALRALKIPVDVHHFNEGHAVFAGLEILRRQLASGLSFDRAIAATRRQVVFTTHTPVPAGNEQHPLALLREVGALDGLTRAQAVAIGGSPFNMTAAALRLARAANAVAELHGVVAVKMWAHLRRAAPIHPITNAVHVGTWVDPRILAAAHRPAALWDAHQANKRALIQLIAKRTGVRLDPSRLLIGFSRRAASYKRWDLVFSDRRRLDALLKQRRIQFVFSGKAHPNDSGGRAMIERVIAIGERYPNAMAFLPNYDMTIGAALTRGADVWLNSPRRPNEASGTSGMKAAINGVLNLSTLDGWWPEACQHGVNGWQYGDGLELDPPEKQDRHDARELARVLLTQVVPTYYDNHAGWVAMMRASIESTRTRFCADRMLADYYRTLYTVA
ncbi:MAG: alpha-glucan family phosphorylase [Lentisphaerae bacterium]|nr:alpha-glucan family phosphorylase [Lentisphaerota bacterium]